MFITLTTPAGREINVSLSLDWDLGAALYKVAEIDGTVSLGWDGRQYPSTGDPDRWIEVTYGRAGDNPFARNHEDAPRVFGVLLAATAVFRESSMQPDRDRWLVVRRDDGARDAPDATRRRTAEIVYALAEHFLAQPWSEDLFRAHDFRHARSRLAGHRTRIRTLREQVQQLTAEVEEEAEGARVQAAIIDAGPVAPKHQRTDGLPAHSGARAA